MFADEKAVSGISMVIGYRIRKRIQINKIENRNGEWIKVQTTAEVHQWVFNAARNSHTRRRALAGP